MLFHVKDAPLKSIVQEVTVNGVPISVDNTSSRLPGGGGGYARSGPGAGSWLTDAPHLTPIGLQQPGHDHASTTLPLINVGCRFTSDDSRNYMCQVAGRVNNVEDEPWLGLTSLLLVRD